MLAADGSHVETGGTEHWEDPGSGTVRDTSWSRTWSSPLGGMEYQALGTDDVAQWDGTKWSFGYDNLQSTDNQVDPWDCVNFTSTSGNAYRLQKEYFVYRTCTTGSAADPTWGTGTSDADPWIFFKI